MTKDLLWHHGEQYAGDALDPATVDPDPLAQFRAWFRAAEERGLPKVNAMTLATATADGRPSARIVLLKEVDLRGFVFYTNYGSRKGDELAANPRAALLFYWEALDRQVRVEGDIERVTAEESDAYFAARPRASQIGAHASPQSRPIASRQVLEARIEEVERGLDGATPPRPAHWGGFRVLPTWIELWQGQPSRLHDRVLYRLLDGGWIRERLAP